MHDNSCRQLTSSSIKTIGGKWPQLSSLDLCNLNRLRDSAMRHLCNGCRLIKKLKLQRNTFRLETLLHMQLLATVPHTWRFWIFPFRRELTNEALGLIIDSCSSLRILKLFWCTQITDVFLKGHLNCWLQLWG